MDTTIYSICEARSTCVELPCDIQSKVCIYTPDIRNREEETKLYNRTEKLAEAIRLKQFGHTEKEQIDINKKTAEQKQRDKQWAREFEIERLQKSGVHVPKLPGEISDQAMDWIKMHKISEKKCLDKLEHMEEAVNRYKKNGYLVVVGDRLEHTGKEMDAETIIVHEEFTEDVYAAKRPEGVGMMEMGMLIATCSEPGGKERIRQMERMQNMPHRQNKYTVRKERKVPSKACKDAWKIMSTYNDTMKTLEDARQEIFSNTHHMSKWWHTEG